jgi:hypothetical protein
MIESLSRLFGIAADEKDLDNYEPIYGLPKHSLDGWLARNPILRQEYDAKLRDFYARYRRRATTPASS